MSAWRLWLIAITVIVLPGGVILLSLYQLIRRLTHPKAPS